jgi:DNA polymerase elongation subunit (family B)
MVSPWDCLWLNHFDKKQYIFLPYSERTVTIRTNAFTTAMKKSPAKSVEIEVIYRPNITLPVEVWQALRSHSKKLGVDVNGGAVQAIKQWVEATQDQVIFPG